MPSGALPQRDGLLQSFALATSDAIVIVDGDDVICVSNPAIDAVFGYSPAELLGSKVALLLFDDSVLRVTAVCGQRTESVGRHKSGVTFPVEVLFGEFEQEGRYYSTRVIRDLRVRDPRKELADSSILFYRHLFASNLVGVVRWHADGRISEANDAFLGMLGYARKEVARAALDWRSLSPPECLPLCLRALSELRVRGITAPFMQEYIRKDGERVAVVIGPALMDMQQRDSGLMFILNVSAQRSAEREAFRLARIIESASDAIVGISPKGLIETWNYGAENLYLYSKVEAMGSSYEILIPPSRLAEWQALLAKSRPGMPLEQFESVCVAKGGCLKPVAVTFSPIFDLGNQDLGNQDLGARDSETRNLAIHDLGSGDLGNHDLGNHDFGNSDSANRGVTNRAIGMSIIARDLSEVKRAEALEERFRQAQKLEAVGRFAGGIAHDFNNLLMVISSYAQLVQQDMDPEDPLQCKMEKILVAVKHGSSLTRQMLAFSRKQLLCLEVMDLDDLVDETTSMVQSVIGDDVKLVRIKGPSHKLIEADSGQIVQILMNLCVNARDAMPQGGTIRIETGLVTVNFDDRNEHPGVQAGSYCSIVVSDTGLGMSKEIRERIFEPFFTTKEPGRGTGLGLATVYGIVQHSGGYISVASKAGAGTAFTILLPLSSKKREQSAMVQPVLFRSTDTILIVEDEEPLRESLAEYVQNLGCTVLTASDGVEALEVAGNYKGPIDVLVTDILMPNMSGKELAKELLRDRRQLKLLFMSGYTDEDVVEQGISDMGFAFIQKPFSLSKLREKLQELKASSPSAFPKH